MPHLMRQRFKLRGRYLPSQPRLRRSGLPVDSLHATTDGRYTRKYRRVNIDVEGNDLIFYATINMSASYNVLFIVWEGILTSFFEISYNPLICNCDEN